MQPRPFSTASALASFPTQDSQEESFYLASVRQWTDQDVATWLTGCKCAAYASLFRQNDLCGEVILDLTQASLKEMGITSVGDRARILVAVKQLRQKCYASTSTSTAARRTTMPPGGWPATRRYSFSAPATPFFSPTGAISETAPVTPGSAPFYAPTGAIYFSPLPEMDMQSEDSPATQTPSAPGFSGLAATSATPAIRIQNPSPLESSSDRSRLADPANREVQEATKWGVFGSSPLPPSAPSPADSQAPPSPDNEIRSSAPAQQASLETKRRDPISTPAPLPPHMTHGRKLSRRHGQLYIVATPPPPTVQSLKAY